MKRKNGIILGVVCVASALIVAAYFVWWNTNPILPDEPKFVRDWIARQPKIVNDDIVSSVFLGSTAEKCVSQNIVYYELTDKGLTEYYSDTGTLLCDVMAKQQLEGCPAYVTSHTGSCSRIWRSETRN